MHALLDFVLYTIIVTTELHGKYIIQNGSISLVAKYKKIQSILLYVESLIENSVTVTSLKHQLQLNMASLPRRLRM